MRKLTPDERWDQLFAHVMWMDEPTWKKRGCGTSLAVVVLVSCGLWAAVLVPLILWGSL